MNVNKINKLAAEMTTATSNFTTGKHDFINTAKSLQIIASGHSHCSKQLGILMLLIWNVNLFSIYLSCCNIWIKFLLKNKYINKYCQGNQAMLMINPKIIWSFPQIMHKNRDFHIFNSGDMTSFTETLCDFLF